MSAEIGRTPMTPEKRLDIRPDTLVRLQKILTEFGSILKNWLLDFGKEKDILQKLKESETQAIIKLEHDASKITGLLHGLEEDAKVSWWESIFGYSLKATSFFNLLIHPIIVLILLVLVMYLVWMILHRKMKRLAKNAHIREQHLRTKTQQMMNY